MTYYEYDPDSNNFNSLGLIENRSGSTDCAYVLTMCRNLNPVADDWVSPQFHGFDEDDVGVEGDFPSYTHYRSIPIFSERAWRVLEPLLRKYVEPLPINHPAGDLYFLIHVINRIDVLDEKRSEFLRNRTTGHIAFITKYAFVEDNIRGYPIFQLSNGGTLVVTDEFRQIVEENDLKGLLFKALPMV